MRKKVNQFVHAHSKALETAEKNKKNQYHVNTVQAAWQKHRVIARLHSKSKVVAANTKHVSSIGYLLTTLIVMNTVSSCITQVTASNAVESTKNKLSNKSSKTHSAPIKQICQRSMKASNKPINMTIGMEGKVLKPLTCITHPSSPECIQQQRQLSNHRYPTQALRIARETATTDYDKWATHCEEKYTSTHQTMPRFFRTKFARTFEAISYLMHSKKIEQHTLALNEGNCGEHIAQNLLSLIQADPTLKIQLVVLSLNEPSAYSSIADHVYLLLDSDISDIVINNNAEKIQYILNKIHGVICDTWNNIFIDTKNDHTGLYKGAWDNLEIRTVSLNHETINSLPEQAKSFICEQIKLIVKDHPACLFNDKQTNSELQNDSLNEIKQKIQ